MPFRGNVTFESCAVDSYIRYTQVAESQHGLNVTSCQREKQKSLHFHSRTPHLSFLFEISITWLQKLSELMRTWKRTARHCIPWNEKMYILSLVSVGFTALLPNHFQKCSNVFAYRTEHRKSRWSQSIWSPEKKKHWTRNFPDFAADINKSRPLWRNTVREPEGGGCVCRAAPKKLSSRTAPCENRVTAEQNCTTRWKIFPGYINMLQTAKGNPCLWVCTGIFFPLPPRVCLRLRLLE